MKPNEPEPTEALRTRNTDNVKEPQVLWAFSSHTDDHAKQNGRCHIRQSVTMRHFHRERRLASLGVGMKKAQSQPFC